MNIQASFEKPVAEHLSEPEKHSVSLEHIINVASIKVFPMNND